MVAQCDKDPSSRPLEQLGRLPPPPPSPMVFSRHPDVATRLVVQLEGKPESPCLTAAADAATQMLGVRGFVPPSWREVLTTRPPPWRNQDDFELGSSRPGCQHETSSRIEQQFRDMLFAARLSPSAKATIRSQGGPGAAMALVTPHVPQHDHSPSAVPRYSLASLAPPSPPYRALLPVWSPIR